MMPRRSGNVAPLHTRSMHSVVPPTQAGVSLVELMVAVALGAVVVLSLAQILVTTKATYLREEEFARLQENGRIAATLLAKEMRASRSLDCKSLAMHQEQASLTVKACDLIEASCTLGAPNYLGTERALGYDQSDGLTNPAKLADLPRGIAESVAERYVGGDILVVWGVEPMGIAMQGTLGADGTADIALTRTPTLKPGDLALLSNCHYAHVFQASDVRANSVAHGGEANAVSHMRAGAGYAGPAPYNRNDADPRASLYPFVYRVFYVCCVRDGSLGRGSTRNRCQPASATYQPQDHRPALCVYDRQFAASQRNQVLVPNVADMRVTFSGDADGDGKLDFMGENAALVQAAARWAAVRSVAVELLLSTEADNTAGQPSVPTAADWPPAADAADRLGADYPADSRLYQRFRLDVALRSASPWAVVP